MNLLLNRTPENTGQLIDAIIDYGTACFLHGMATSDHGRTFDNDTKVQLTEAQEARMAAFHSLIDSQVD